MSSTDSFPIRAFARIEVNQITDAVNDLILDVNTLFGAVGVVPGGGFPLSTDILPEMFGAVGDGVTDDTTAFRNLAAWVLETIPDELVTLRGRPGAIYMVGFPWWPAGIKKLKFYGNGCVIQNNATNNRMKMLHVPTYGLSKKDPATGGFSIDHVDSYLINTTTIGATTVTTTTAADAGNVVVDEMLMIGSLAKQFGGFPPNYVYFEWVKVIATNPGTGVITLDRRIKYAHSATNPYISPAPENDGRARIWRVEQASLWSLTHEYYDITWRRNVVSSGGLSTEATFCEGENITFVNCVSPYFVTTVADRINLQGCTQTDVGEFDKLVTALDIEDSIFTASISSATGIDTITAHGVKWLNGFSLCPRVLKLDACQVSGAANSISTFNSFGLVDSISITDGIFENLPTGDKEIANQAGGLMTIDGVNVTWSAPFLTVNMNATEPVTGAKLYKPLAQFLPGRIINVVTNVAGNAIFTGVTGIVRSVTDSGSAVAVIEIEFSSAIAGTEILYSSVEPLEINIEDTVVAGVLTNRNYLSVVRKNYDIPTFILTSNNTRTGVCDGVLRRIYVNVLRGYTGASGGNKVIRLFSTQPNAAGSFDLSVDVRTVGEREATASFNRGWTGAAGESVGANLDTSAAKYVSRFSISGPTIASASNAELPIIQVKLSFNDGGGDVWALS